MPLRQGGDRLVVAGGPGGYGPEEKLAGVGHDGDFAKARVMQCGQQGLPEKPVRWAM